MINYYTKHLLVILSFFLGVKEVTGQGTIASSNQHTDNLGQGIIIKVVDGFGAPLSGVPLFDGEVKIAESDKEGEISIEKRDIEKKLILKKKGWDIKKIKIKNDEQTMTVVRMQKNYLRIAHKVHGLYDKKEKENLIGAVSEIYSPQVTTTPTPLYLNALTGRLPGLYTQIANGFRSALTAPLTYNDLAGSLPTNDPARSFPGEEASNLVTDNTEMLMQIRGQNPVTLIDGVQRNIYSIDPEDIASVTVLKDALSSILLGMKSSRGVLQIITRKGKEGAPRFSFSAQRGFQSPLKEPTPLKAYQYAYLYNEALLNEGENTAYSKDAFKSYRNHSSPFLYPDVNWYNTILKKQAPISKYHLSVNGGMSNARYYISLSYMDQGGLFKENRNVDYHTNLRFKRYVVNSNVNVDITDYFTIGLQVLGRIKNGNQPGAGWSSVLNSIYSTPNNAYPVFNPDGSYGGTSEYTNNLYEQAMGSGYLSDNSKDLLANIDLKYNFNYWIPGLYAKGKVNVSATSSNIVDRSKSDPVYGLSLRDSGEYVYTRFGSISDQSNSFNATSLAQSFYAQVAIGYDTCINKHHFGGMLFADFQKETFQFLLPKKYENLAFTANYNYNHKYLAELAIDYAGFDRYAPGHRFGFVYAGGFVWNVAEENFVADNFSWIDDLKLRATFGQTANSNEGALGYFSWRRAFGQDGNESYPAGVNYSSVNGIKELGLANRGATWEKAHKWNIGFDMSLFHNSVKITGDYYHDTYYDLLQQRGSSVELIGISYPNENIGKNLYEGQELSISYVNHVGSFNYFITANVSRMKTKVLYIDELERKYPWNERTGMPIGQTFGYLADGLIQTEKEAEHTATFEGEEVEPGDVKLVDLNQDGVINQFDETAIGNTKPIVYYGTTLGFHIKGIDFSILLQGVKNRTYQHTDYSFESGKGQGYAYMLGRWTPESAGKASYPRLMLGSNANNMPFLNNSSYWTRSGEYFRVRNIAIGYTIPYKLTQKIKISTIKVFANAQNLFTKTSFDRLDPEVPDFTSYPLQRVINMGVEIKF